MLEKLQAIARRLDQVERQLSDPAVYADREFLTLLSREQKELTPIVAAFRAWQQAETDCAGAQELLSDPEMRELAQEELHRARQERDRPVGGAQAPAAAPGPQRRPERHPGGPGRHRRRGGGPVCGGPATDVRPVCRAPGLEHGTGV